MSVVPVTGPASFREGTVPRESAVEFTDGRRTVTLPVRAALPVLGRAHRRDDAHPTVALLSGASLLGMRLVAAGSFAPDEDGGRWRPVLSPEDEDRVEQLALARADGGFDVATAEGVVRAMIDAVVDAMPGSPPLAGRPGHRAAGGGRDAGRRDRSSAEFAQALQDRIARMRSRPDDDRPQVVRLSLRIEASEEELHAGVLSLVPQVHDERDPLHVADAAALWTESGPGAAHGFGDRARTHATLALREAAEAWPVLDRFLDALRPEPLELATDDVVNLLEEGLGRLQAIGVDVHWPRDLGRDLTARATLDQTQGRAPGSRARSGPSEAPLQTGLLGPDSLFAFRWQLSLHGETLTEEEMDQLATAATPVVKLRDNWVVVDPEAARKARRRLIRTARPAEAVAAALTGVVQVEDRPDVEVAVGASLLTVRERLLRATEDAPPVRVPTGLAATLRHYQHEGLTWLAGLTDLGLGGCLADDMGLGKTIQLIGLHLHRQEQGPGGPTLVVCPTSLLGNWEAEIRRFAPGVAVRRFHGGARDLADLPDGFVLTTYGTLRSDAGAPEPALTTVDWDMVVADEAQHVKNSRTSTARALRGVPSRVRVALTGTPVENELTELWSILDWTVPGLLGSRLAFRRVWAAPIEAGVDPRVTERFNRLIAPFVLRRRKSDPGIAPELPPKTETEHLVGLTREQAVLYESLVRDRMERIERADPESRRGLVLALLTGLKQICNHPAQFLKESNPRLAGRSEKLELLDELLGTVLAEEGAVLVFTQYVAMARLLERHLSRAHVPHLFLHGGTAVKDRESMVASFQSGEAPVFLLSLKAGGTGLNLTRADHVVHFDRWWNPAVEDQATDRAYRIGQTRPVQVHRFVTQGTVEERVAELLARKRAVADAVLARGDTALTELSDAELRSLVELR